MGGGLGTRLLPSWPLGEHLGAICGQAAAAGVMQFEWRPPPPRCTHILHVVGAPAWELQHDVTPARAQAAVFPVRRRTLATAQSQVRTAAAWWALHRTRV